MSINWLQNEQIEVTSRTKIIGFRIHLFDISHYILLSSFKLKIEILTFLNMGQTRHICVYLRSFHNADQNGNVRL